VSAIASRGATRAVDWEQRVDFARLRSERLERARRALRESDLSANEIVFFESRESARMPCSRSGPAELRSRCTSQGTRCKSQERCSSDLPWRLVVAKAISDSKEVGR
jgi:hypothetical protein